MHHQNYQEILSRVMAPTRYSGQEINTVRKDWDQVDLTVALAFPDLYEIGISHFGLQILYAILNREETIAAERFFAPAPDMAQALSQAEIPLLSMESGKPLSGFDIIGVSLLYELNFTNILTLFRLGKIPFLSEERGDAFPLVIGGGPCAFNPEPLADFFDAFVIGDGEQALVEVCNAVSAFKASGDGRKKSLLRHLSGIQGVYVPSFFTPAWDGDGIQHLTPVYEDYTRVTRAFLPDLDRDSFPESPIVPFGKPVHDRLRLEIARGCSRGCRFCQAGMIYRPVRERDLDDLIRISEQSLKTTGYADISLLSLSAGDYSCLPQLMGQLMALDPGHCTSLSLPSVRAERLTPELMDIIRQARKTGFTIAPEAGSQRLRDIINKNLTEQSIEDAVRNALSLGWKTIKLYFMTGLPFETRDDIQAICDLSTRLARDHAKGKQAIHVSTTGFIPKAHTPFQRVGQMSLVQTREKLQMLKDNLRHKKIKLKWQDPGMSLVEGVWARGDRRLAPLLTAAFDLGCVLDGWSDHFDLSKWEAAFDQTGIDPAFYTTRARTDQETLPWDHIDSGVDPAFFKEEYDKAARGALTPDCRDHGCTGCGVCDFKTLKPRLNDPPRTAGQDSGGRKPSRSRLPDEDFTKFELVFSKLGTARFFGHLELATLFRRAIRRTARTLGIAVKYSRGFNPAMRLSFENALPVGMESESERAFVYLETRSKTDRFMAGLNRQLPEGLAVQSFGRYHKQSGPVQDVVGYRVGTADRAVTQKEIQVFLDRDTVIMEDVSKKGKIRRTDLRQAVKRIHLERPGQMRIDLEKVEQRTVRPGDVLVHGFGFTPEQAQNLRIRKLAAGPKE